MKRRLKHLPVGVDDFRKMVDKENEFLYVDKSLVIQEIIDDRDEVTLITRPRRWGKTLNLSMLYYFFSLEVNGMPTKGLFSNLKISKVEDCMKQQGKHPVIFLSLKDVKESNYKDSIVIFSKIIQKLFRETKFICSKLDKEYVNEFNKYIDGTASPQDLQASLNFLTEAFFKYSKQQCYLLIDEYDTPLNKAYEKLKMVIDTLPTLVSIKRNANNFYQNSILALNGITKWYNGYESFGVSLYNPWSIICCLSKDRLGLHWVNTSEDALVKRLLIQASPKMKQSFQDLMNEGSQKKLINEHIAYGDLNDEMYVWSLFVFTGYLTFKDFHMKKGYYECDICIPNSEVRILFEKIIVTWFQEEVGNHYESFLQNLISYKVKEMVADIGEYLVKVSSVHDFSKHPEAFYHGFVLGLIASLLDTHFVHSNRESGLGRYDVVIIPKPTRESIGILLEFKHVKENQDPQREAEKGLEQIEVNLYDTELKQFNHIKKALKICLGFSGKSVSCAFKEEDLSSLSTEVIVPDIELDKE